MLHASYGGDMLYASYDEGACCMLVMMRGHVAC